MRLGRAQAGEEFAGSSVKRQSGPASRQTLHLDIAPTDATAPSGSDGLHARLLGGKSGRVTFDFIRFRLTVADFLCGKDPLSEPHSEPVDALRDAADLGYVDTGSDDHVYNCKWRRASLLRSYRLVCANSGLPS